MFCCVSCRVLAKLGNGLRLGEVQFFEDSEQAIQSLKPLAL